MDILKGYYFPSFIYCPFLPIYCLPLPSFPFLSIAFYLSPSIYYLLSISFYLLLSILIYLLPSIYLLLSPSYLLPSIYPLLSIAFPSPSFPFLPTYQTKIIYKYQRHICIYKAKKQTPKRLQMAWIFLKRIL